MISKFREAGIDHSLLTQTEKDEQKHQWKQWLDITTQGFKEALKREGRMI